MPRIRNLRQKVNRVPGRTGRPLDAPTASFQPPPDAGAPKPKLVFHQRSAHHDVYVYEQGTTRSLIFEPDAGATTQTSFDICASTVLESYYGYTRAMLSAVAMHAAPSHVLCLGVGGGAMPRALQSAFPDTVVDAVDIDATVLDVAREWFGLCGNDRLRLHASDARSFLRQACAQGRRWDVILHDVFDRHYTPVHLMTAEFYRELTAVLAEGGLVAINAFAQGELRDRESATFCEVFADVFEIAAGVNRVVVGFPACMPDTDAMWENLCSHEEGLIRAGIRSGEMARHLRPVNEWPASTRPLRDEDRACPQLAKIRRRPRTRLESSTHGLWLGPPRS